LVFVGHEIGLAIVFGDRAGAAFDAGGENFFDAGTDVEKSRAQGAEQSFVAGGGQKIDVIGLDIDGNVSGGLGGIDNEGNIVLARDGADLAKRLERAG